ncbi:MAG TPA: hypothetical protein VFQ07_05860 [Candidatus Polarisedimenticolia bacterium]|nr:hypothetical protein [Candidatus Polarisedimenticolia bacterium]
MGRPDFSPISAGVRHFACLILLLGLGALPAAAAIELVGTRVLDDPSLQNSNSDGSVEPGEWFYLFVYVLNLNSTTVTPQGSLIYTGSLPGVQVYSGGSTFHQVLPGQIYYNPNTPFQVRLSGTLACGLVLPFRLVVNDGVGGSIDTSISITLGRATSYDLVVSPSIRVDQNEATFWGPASGGAGGSVVFGDFNGDGLKDAVIGSPTAGVSGRPGSGIVYLALGRRDTWGNVDLASPTGLTRIVGADPGDNLGVAMAAGDLNGDGRDDLILAARGGDGPGTGSCIGNGVGDRCDSGEIDVIFGRGAFPSNIDLLNPANAVHLFGPIASSGVVNSMAAADTDGDGMEDLVIGFPFVSLTAGRGGTVYLVHGKPGTSWPDVDLAFPEPDVSQVVAAEAQERLGDRVSAGDVDGDGLADVILGRPLLDANGAVDSGEIDVLFGDPSWFSDIDLRSPPASLSRFTGEKAGDQLSVSAIGDFDGDHMLDLALGAPKATDDLARVVGKGYIDYGPIPPGTTLGLAQRVPGLAHIIGNFGDFGSAMAAGDIDADGFDDLAITAVTGAPSGRTDAGVLYLIHGKAQRWNGLSLATPLPGVEWISGADAGDRMGTSIAAGDADGDGFADLLLGAPQADGPGNGRSNGGEAALWYGKPTHTFTPRTGTASFIDATAGGTLLPGLWCDDCEVPVSIGFPFQYDGRDYSQVWVSSNGFIAFGPVANSLQTRVPECMPDRSPVSGANGVIAPLWTDLNPGQWGAVYMRVDGGAPYRRFTVEWSDVARSGAPGNGATFEVTLFEGTGQILMQYLDLDFGDPAHDNGRTAVIGVESVTGAHGVPASCFSNTQVTGGTALRFYPGTSITEQTAEHGRGLWSPPPSTHPFHLSQDVCEPDQHSGTRSWYAGYDSSCNFFDPFLSAPWDLLVPTIPNLPTDAVMTYSHRQGVDSFGGTIIDPCRVLASTTGTGGTYAPVQEATSNAGVWQTLPEPFGFPGLAGQTVDLLLRMDANTSGGNSGVGWMVDDIRLNGCNAVRQEGAALSYLNVATICVGSSARFDGIGSYCPGGAAPLQHHWLLGGSEVGTGPVYGVPPSLAAGSYVYTQRLDCPGGVTVESPAPTLTVVASPPARVGDTLTVDASTATTTMTFHWSDIAGATGYNVLADVVPNGSFPYNIGTSTSGVAGATTYLYTNDALFFRIQAVNVCGGGPIN